MTIIDFSPKERLSHSDQIKLQELASAEGLTPGDLIEDAVKRLLFGAGVKSLAKPARKTPAKSGR
jgi:hypothetical protein